MEVAAKFAAVAAMLLLRDVGLALAETDMLATGVEVTGVPVRITLRKPMRDIAAAPQPPTLGHVPGNAVRPAVNKKCGRTMRARKPGAVLQLPDNSCMLRHPNSHRCARNLQQRYTPILAALWIHSV